MTILRNTVNMGLARYYGFPMKTTVEIPDELFRRAKAVAALRGQSMKQFITQSLTASLSSPPLRARGRNDGADGEASAAAVAEGVAEAFAKAFSAELSFLAARISAEWQGAPDAVASVREQRRDFADDS